MIRIWNPIPDIRGDASPDIVVRDCDNSEVHDWHFLFDGASMVYCPGPMKVSAFPATLTMCQDKTDVAKALPCEYRESGGYRCERLDSHPEDSGHFYGRHTIAHSIAGNGHDCTTIEDSLRKFHKGLDKKLDGQ